MLSLSHWLNRILCFLLTLTLVAACSGHGSLVQLTPNSHPSSSLPLTPMRVVKHAMGETQVPTNPQRVVTLDTGHLANALALGVQPIGFTAWFQIAHKTGLSPVESYLRQYSETPTILGYGFSASQVSLEKLLLLKPDLILATEVHKPIYGLLSKIAPTVLYDYPIGNEWKEHLKMTADVLGKSQAAETLLQGYEQRIQSFKQKMRDRAANPQVSAISPHSLNDLVGIMYLDYFGGSIMQNLGLSRPPEQNRESLKSGPVSYESIPEMDGDVIISISFDDQDSLKGVERLQKHPLWSQLDAVRQGNVYPVNGEHWHGGDIIAANLVLDDLFKYLVAE